MTTFRQILSSKLNNQQKALLRTFFNEQNGKEYTSISQITNFYRFDNSDYTYEYIRKFYNKDIIEKQKTQRRERERVAKENKNKKYYTDNVIVVNRTDSLYEILKNLKGKSLVITIYKKKGGDILTTRNETIPKTNKEFYDWWKKIGVWIIQKTSDETIYDEYPNAVIYIYEGSTKIVKEKIKQYFKEGNVNCLLKPIFAWANKCKEISKSSSAKSRYNAIINKLKKISNEIGNNGVSEIEALKISNEIQIDISIEKPIITNDDKYVIEAKSNKKALKHMIMRNTKLNHVELNEFVYLNNIEIVERDELYKIKNKLESEGTYYEFKRDLDGYTSINTLDKTWRLSNEFFEMINDMEITEGLNECYIDDVDDAILSSFIKNGTHYNGTIDFVEYPKSIENVKHMDMKNAYANYEMCDYYEGFLGKITDWRKTNKIEGVGLYQIHNLVIGDKLKWLNDKMRVYFDFNIYPSCELNWLNDNGATFDIMYGCWGVKPIYFDMNDYQFLFNKYNGVKGYAKYVGMCDSHYLTKKFSCYGTEELASTLNNCIWFKNNELTIEYPKKHNYHFGHFTAFITAYQRIQMLDELLYMDKDNLVRVCVDGIYYTGDEKIINPIFVPKSKMTFENIAGDSYISNIIDVPQYWDCGVYKQNNRLELYIGEGGNGKTHKNLMDKGLIRKLYIAPSWKLASNKRLEYGIDSEVWANILTDDPAKYGSIKRRYNVFVIDEVSMMTEDNKNSIFEKFDNIKLIFCGDIGFQAPPFSLKDMTPVKEITKEGFDIIYTETQNYRYKCNKLKNIISSVREMISYDRPNFEINNYVKSMFQKISNEDIKKMYTIDDMILSRTHLIKDSYTEMFKDLEKWYITKNTRLFKNGQIVIGNKPDATCEIRHSYTIHSIQGETANNKLFINMEKSYDGRLLYTAISRARKADQIILIV